MASTTAHTVSAETLRGAPAAYFAAVDALDVPRVLTHFAEDATLTVQTAGVTFTGHEEIGRMFTGFFADWESMVHDIVNLVVDESAGKVATEQFVDLVSGETTRMHNCNFFTLGADGRFTRVIIWMDGANPLN